MLAACSSVSLYRQLAEERAERIRLEWLRLANRVISEWGQNPCGLRAVGSRQVLRMASAAARRIAPWAVKTPSAPRLALRWLDSSFGASAVYARMHCREVQVESAQVPRSDEGYQLH
ncbi:hypothetical protein ACFL5O_09545 [Myxococcota bacterium]